MFKAFVFDSLWVESGFKQDVQSLPNPPEHTLLIPARDAVFLLDLTRRDSDNMTPLIISPSLKPISFSTWGFEEPNQTGC